MLIIVATTVKRAMTIYGTAFVSMAGIPALEFESEPVAELPEPDAPLLPVALPDPAEDVIVNPAAVSVAAAAKSCSDEYVTQFDDAGMVGV